MNLLSKNIFVYIITNIRALFNTSITWNFSIKQGKDFKEKNKASSLMASLFRKNVFNKKVLTSKDHFGHRDNYGCKERFWLWTQKPFKTMKKKSIGISFDQILGSGLWFGLGNSYLHWNQSHISA